MDAPGLSTQASAAHRSRRWKRACIAIASLAFASVAAELGHRVWRAARGNTFDAAATLADLHASAHVETTSESRPEHELFAILNPYYGAESVHDPAGLIARFTAEPESDALRVLVFGGSVAVFFAGATETLVERGLSGDPRLGGRRVELLNGAHHGYKQPQQLNKLAYFLARGVRPDLVVELDGFNEIALARSNWNARTDPAYPTSSLWSIPVQTAAFTAEDHARIGEEWNLRREARELAACAERWGLHHSSVASGWFLARIAERNARIVELERAQASTDAVLPGTPLWHQVHGPDVPPNGKDAAELCLTVWEECSVSMAALCAARGIPYLHVLQPTLQDRNSKPLTPHEAKLAAEYFEWTGPILHNYPRLRERGAHLAARGVEFVDASRVFADVHDELYYDYCHFTDAGSELLWRSVEPRVVEMLARAKRR